MRVGIPNCFIYLNMAKFLSEFISMLNNNIEIITSPMTTKQLIVAGVEKSVDEICVPAKAFIGHVEYLLNEDIDVLLMPRVTSVHYGTYSCPKIIGIPDMIRAQYRNINILSPELNMREKKGNFYKFLLDLGSYFTNDKKLILKSIKNYDICHLFDYPQPHINKEKNILILAHNYIMFDHYLNCGILKIIKYYDYNPVYPNYFCNFQNNCALNLEKAFFWNIADTIFKSFIYTIQKNKIDGIIYLMSFGCGIDSILEDMVKRRSKIMDIPYVCITIDEHSANLGIQTRVEAFIDMIDWRRFKGENNISPYGQSLYGSQTNV